MTSFQRGVSALMFLCSGRKWLVFSVRIEINCVFVSEHRIDLIFEWGSKLTWFQWRGRLCFCYYVQDRNWLGFSVEIEIDFFLCGSRNRLRFCVRVESWLVFIYGSKLTWFLAWGSKLTWFLCTGGKRLVFSVGIAWHSFFAGGRHWLGFCMLAESQLVLMWAWNLTSFLCGWSKLTWLNYRGSNLTWFQCRDRNRIGFGVGVENDLALVFGSKLSSF